MKKYLALLLTLGLLCGLLASCRTQPPALETADRWVDGGEPATIKILTERFMWSDSPDMVLANKASHLLGSLGRIIDYFEHEHPNVTVEVEYVTISPSTRETEMQARRVALMGGDVPDLYLMPTMSSEIFYQGRDMENGEYPFVFRDPAQAMTNGWFADVAPYYNGDEELHTEGLVSGVMEAGMLDNQRLILPLGYDMDLMFLDKKEREASHLDQKALGNYGSTVNHVLELDDLRWVTGLSVFGQQLNLLPALCDYQKEKLLLKQEDAVQFLKDSRRLSDGISEYYQDYFDRHPDVQSIGAPYLFSYLGGEKKDAFSPELPAIGLPLRQAVDVLAICKAQGFETEILPLRDVGGKLSANITYWGAVSSGSKNIPLAYEFLRLFLTPEVQWGGTLTCQDGTTFKTGFLDRMYESEDLYITPGWPVRSQGAVEARWEKIYQEAKRYERNALVIADKAPPYITDLLAVEVTEEDLPFLAEGVDRARFPSVVDLWFDRLSSTVLYPGLEAQPLTDQEIAAKTEEFLRELRYHLAEG